MRNLVLPSFLSADFRIIASRPAGNVYSHPFAQHYTTNPSILQHTQTDPYGKTFSAYDFWYNTTMFSWLILATLLTNCADVTSSAIAQRIGDTFDVTGQVLVCDNSGDPILHVADKTGSVQIMGVRHVATPLPFKSGDIIRATGIIAVPADFTRNITTIICKSAQLVAEGSPPPPILASARDVTSGKYSGRLVTVHGRIRRVIRDEVSTPYLFISLSTPDGIIYLTEKCDSDKEEHLRQLVDAKINATGVCNVPANAIRRLFGFSVTILNPQDISVITPPADNSYTVPLLDDLNALDMAAVNLSGRRRIVGTVIAVCSGGRVIVQSDRRTVHDVLLTCAPFPESGMRIEVVGIPEADYYQINLLDAIWREAPGDAMPTSPPHGVTIDQLLTNGRGDEQIEPSFHGKVVRTSGTIIDMPTRESGRDFAILKDNGRTILLDLSSAKQVMDDVAIGYHVDVTGVCTANREPSALPQQHFQRVNGITLVVRDPKDVVVVSRPPWWTPQRLTVLVAVLLLVLVLIFIWNRLLQRVIDRKSRQLLREHTAHIKAALRVEERTNLAVELHDSLSQNLSGVACQIAATKSTLPDDAEETARHLSTAERMLLSCRTELRRCLWDLRENAISEKDFADAVRKTLDPVVVGAIVQINFDVPRTRLDETIAHAILCIIRELASNAVRHGKAKNIRISGELREHTIFFSVADDGCGFVPGDAAGADEGHFGLDGILERIKRLDGSFSIASEPGNGCKATATIPLATND